MVDICGTARRAEVDSTKVVYPVAKVLADGFEASDSLTW